MRVLQQVFPGVEPHHVQEAARVVSTADLELGMQLIVRGESDRTVIVLLDGEVSLRRDDIELGVARASELVGELELFGPSRRVLSAKAVTAGSVLIFERPVYDALVRARNPIAYALERRVIAQAVSRLRGYHVRISELSRGSATERPMPQPGLVSRMAGSLGLWGSHMGDLGLAEALGELTPFRGVDLDSRRALGQHLEARSVKAGQVLCRLGERADQAFFLAGGAIEVVVSTDDSHGDSLAILEPGAVLGFTSMEAGEARMAACVAHTDALVLSLKRSAWAVLREEDSPQASALRQAIAADLGFQTARALDQLVVLEQELRSRAHDSLSSVDGATRPSHLDGLFRG